MNRITSSKEVVNKILDFSTIYIQRLGKRDKVDTDFIEKVNNLKDHNGLITPKPYYQETVDDKLLNFYKVDHSMHVKIDKNLLPKNQKVSYFDAIQASENLGQGPYKLTRYKVYEERSK